ncbi:dolichol-phosphate mannosyltransferase subunit 3 [Meira miltonrushii]|uniref:Dolichol-phosphate mannosyltransferase subunit 3 n=1 Tax=Meira miltonrushii TaxID=1280837 RepID=A0A316VE32_9BASI|nr:dolichol-phosphate mannosyltransferase subunit 3 [Meira miltonrushii]PWN34261.1 dolichol-phosphate mannosyltransferase subunit 3 [Meira miltonrushii]
MTTRAQRFFTSAAILSAIWLLLLLDILPFPLIDHTAKQEILSIPWWILVSTGSYLLFQIGWGLWTFNDVPKAYDDLMIDIKNAKDYLGSRGVNID